MLSSMSATSPSAYNNQFRLQSTVLSPTANAPFDHIVTILMENQGLCDVYTGCGGSATYMSQLADQNVLVMTWGTTSHPSEGNYISLIGGDNFGHTSDGYCCWGINAPNLVDRLESAGLTWQAWAEDASGSGCPNSSFSNGGFAPPRGGDHFPFLTFADMNAPARCSHFLTTVSSSDPEFLAVLNTPNPANFIWLTPNDCDNGHDSCTLGQIAGGDHYLSGLVPHILASSEFTSTKATLLILYDEGYTQCANTGGTRECVYASFSGPAAKKGIQISPTGASHYSYLSTIEAAWGLSSLTSNDASAPNMLGALDACTPNCPLTTSFTVSPSAPQVNGLVTFAAITAGGTVPYTVSWSFGDGATGAGVSVTHVYAVAKSFNVTETVTDSSSPSQSATKSQTIQVAKAAPGGSAGTFLGLSNSIWLILIGGLIGLIASLTLLTIRARAKLKHAKQTLNQSDR
jgi:Phosphoesterase family/PKD domain